ncbi:hypothetical protein [Halapricum hydrolyticum]|uniref:Uncharacterized protein n=1 Tax=Halapricum hydrolyticum TaxID=2979991 RepID=A0AAE3IBN4_9EURY|nr:hypothetical protein [Halapricum hydrolyticum]MCU4718490.1 hypothetical protein [Halapricum hydrolyticum]MCU4727491.1 hypothetical protein [Halapricum hydrolyticum]
MQPHDATSFDCFGTLLSVDRPADPAAAVAEGLDRQGIDVPEDWARAYAEPHRQVEPGRERSLVGHVVDALRSRGRDPPMETVRMGVLEGVESRYADEQPPTSVADADYGAVTTTTAEVFDP